MLEEPISKDIIIKRLRKIEGQTRGLQKMLSEDRDCESILIQLTAIRSAIESVGSLILNNYMHFCFGRGEEDNSTKIDSLAKAFAIWGRVKIKE